MTIKLNFIIKKLSFISHKLFIVNFLLNVINHYIKASSFIIVINLFIFIIKLFQIIIIILLYHLLYNILQVILIITFIIYIINMETFIKRDNILAIQQLKSYFKFHQSYLNSSMIMLNLLDFIPINFPLKSLTQIHFLHMFPICLPTRYLNHQQEHIYLTQQVKPFL